MKTSKAKTDEAIAKVDLVWLAIKRRGVDLKDVAKKLDVTPAYVSQGFSYNANSLINRVIEAYEIDLDFEADRLASYFGTNKQRSDLMQSVLERISVLEKIVAQNAIKRHP